MVSVCQPNKEQMSNWYFRKDLRRPALSWFLSLLNKCNNVHCYSAHSVPWDVFYQGLCPWPRHRRVGCRSALLLLLTWPLTRGTRGLVNLTRLWIARFGRPFSSEPFELTLLRSHISAEPSGEPVSYAVHFTCLQLVDGGYLRVLDDGRHEGLFDLCVHSISCKVPCMKHIPP